MASLMPHGDFSDVSAFFCMGAGLAAIWAPQVFTQTFGPVKPFFDGPLTNETTVLLSFMGSLLVCIGIVLFVNRWNTVNGKAGGVGLVIAAANAALIAYRQDKGQFVFRGWHIFSIMFILAALHLSFNANPLWTSETLLAAEKKKKAKSN